MQKAALASAKVTRAMRISKHVCMSVCVNAHTGNSQCAVTPQTFQYWLERIFILGL